jgi:hypothetical protein
MVVLLGAVLANDGVWRKSRAAKLMREQVNKPFMSEGLYGYGE